MVPQEHILTTADDHRIAVHVWRRETRPVGTVHWLHGMAEHGARYARLADALNEAGWNLVTHDHRGHGASVLSERDRGHFSDEGGWDKVVTDVARVREFIDEELDGGQQVLGGHSMGSFIALDLAEREGRHYDGLILCGSDYHSGLYYWLMRLPMLMEYRRHGPRGTSNLVRGLTFDAWNKQIPGAKTDFDWLSANPDEVQAYIDDPYCGHDCTMALWLDLVDAMRRMHKPRALRALPENLPILVIGGNKDPMSHNGKGVRALARALRRQGRRVEETRFAGGRHEILNDQCAAEAQTRICRFLEERVSEAADTA